MVRSSRNADGIHSMPGPWIYLVLLLPSDWHSERQSHPVGGGFGGVVNHPGANRIVGAEGLFAAAAFGMIVSHLRSRVVGRRRATGRRRAIDLDVVIGRGLAIDLAGVGWWRG